MGNQNEQKIAPSARKSSQLIPKILQPGNIALVYFQELLNKVFNPWLNPMYYLGAITFFLFWIVLVTGIYLYLFYDMSPDLAYESVQHIANEQKYYGGIARSLHRYASDGMIIVIVIHILQVLFSDRFRRYRWVAWVSGASILPWLFFEGLSGYVMVWDHTAQIVAIYTAELLDVLHLTVQPLSRNFISENALNSSFFFVLTYLHMTIPLVILVLAWVHCMRIAKPLINPPKQVGVTILLSLILLSIVKPAISMPKANLAMLVGNIDVDWFYLSPFPIMYEGNISAAIVVSWSGAIFLLFILMPWIIPGPRKNFVRTESIKQKPLLVDREKCTGCEICLEVCPFEAVSLEPRSDNLPYEKEVTIIPEKCSECGFCVTACEFSATSMDSSDKSSIQQRIENILSASENVTITGKDAIKPNALAFICERSFDLNEFLSENGNRLKSNEKVAAMVIPCVGVISPSIVDHSLNFGAKGVIIIGCRPLDCHYRETRRRIKAGDNEASARFLIEKMNYPNIKTYFVSRFDALTLVRDIDEFVETLKYE